MQLPESAKRIKYHNKREDSKNYNQLTKEPFSTSEDVNKIDNYKKLNSNLVQKLTDFSNFLSTSNTTQDINLNSNLNIIKLLTDENEELKRENYQLKLNSNQQTQNNSSTKAISSDILTKYMDSMINLQSKIDKLEKENHKLKNYIKKNNENSNYPNESIYNKISNETKIEELIKMQINHMNQMLSVVKVQPSEVDENKYISSLPIKDNQEDSQLSDLCFEESLDVNELSNSNENNDDLKQIYSYNNNNNVANNTSKPKKNPNPNSTSNIVNVNLSQSQAKTNTQSYNFNLHGKEQESLATVKHKNEIEGFNIKNSLFNSKNTSINHNNQPSSSLSGSYSQHNIYKAKNNLNSNTKMMINTKDINQSQTSNIVNQTKRSSYSNNNYIISKAKQALEDKKY